MHYNTPHYTTTRLLLHFPYSPPLTPCAHLQMRWANAKPRPPFKQQQQLAAAALLPVINKEKRNKSFTDPSQTLNYYSTY